MAVKRNLLITKLNDSEKNKFTTLREQFRGYKPKLRSTGVVLPYFSVACGPIGALKRSIETVLPRGSMINLSFIGVKCWRNCAHFSTRERSSTQ